MVVSCQAKEEATSGTMMDSRYTHVFHKNKCLENTMTKEHFKH